MRLFIALNLPKKERERIHRATRALREAELPVRWIEPDSLHITLKFLGEVRPDVVPGVEGALARAAGGTSAFSMLLEGFGAFPTIRRPRVVWLGIEASPELRCLKQDVEWALGDCGFTPETRAFQPHLTLGRAEKAAGAGAFRDLDELVAGLEFRGTVQVRAVDLMQSHLSREGARYTIRSSARLAST